MRPFKDVLSYLRERTCKKSDCCVNIDVLKRFYQFLHRFCMLCKEEKHKFSIISSVNSL